MISLQVAALSGDARRCLDICRRAVEIAESQQQQQHSKTGTSTTRRKSTAKTTFIDTTDNNKGDQGDQRSTTDSNTTDQHRVGMKHVEMALKEMFSSPKILALQSISLMEEMFMKAIISEFRRSGLEEAQFTDVSFF